MWGNTKIISILLCVLIGGAFFVGADQAEDRSKSLPEPPVGSIVAFAGDVDTLPWNWVLCDGSTLNEEHPRIKSVHDVHPSLRRTVLPDLTGRFLRGVLPEQDLLHRGGIANLPDHKHRLGNRTRSVAWGGGNPGRSLYTARDDNQGWSTKVHLRVDGGESQQEGQHRHSLLDLKTTWMDPVEWQPEYVAVHFIIRIN